MMVRCTYTYHDSDENRPGWFVGLINGEHDIEAIVKPDAHHGMLLTSVHPSRVTLLLTQAAPVASPLDRGASLIHCIKFLRAGVSEAEIGENGKPFLSLTTAKKLAEEYLKTGK
jgi:hypothetical protein